MVLRSISKPGYKLVKAVLSTAPPGPASEEALSTAPPGPVSEEALSTASPGPVSEEGWNPFCVHIARAVDLSTGILGEVAELLSSAWMIIDM